MNQGSWLEADDDRQEGQGVARGGEEPVSTTIFIYIILFAPVDFHFYFFVVNFSGD